MERAPFPKSFPCYNSVVRIDTELYMNRTVISNSKNDNHNTKDDILQLLYATNFHRTYVPRTFVFTIPYLFLFGSVRWFLL
jgi:hypothetical protein